MTAAAGSEDSARLRFIHAIAGAAPVDVRVDGQLIVPDLSFASPTPHLALPSGMRDFARQLGRPPRLCLSACNCALANTALLR